jgi:CheY-like chemotaxis protein
MTTVTPLTPFIGDRTPRILIVDDEPTNLKVLAALLTRWGCIVRDAASGAEAIEAIPAFHPDLILLDIMMPEQSGFEVCEILQADPATRHMPIIFLSAVAGEKARAQGLAAGARDYVTKPFMVGDLAARIGAQLRLKYAEERNETAQARSSC